MIAQGAQAEEWRSRIEYLPYRRKLPRCNERRAFGILQEFMSDPKNPFARLNRQELLWLAGILKDACRERLEKNQVSLAFEERFYRRGAVEGRMDPRPFLKMWEPRYRKFLEIATEFHAALEAEDAKAVAESWRAQVSPAAAIKRRGPNAARALERQAMIEGNGANPRRQSRSR